MASALKIQRGQTVFGASADSATAAITAVGALTKAFARITGVSRCAQAPHAGDTVDRNNDDLSMTCLLTAVDTVTFTRRSTGADEDVTVWWEVWEYVGSPGGRDEFVVHVHESITILSGSLTANGASFTPSNAADVVAFLCGVSSANVNETWGNANARMTVIGSAPANARANRATNGGDLTVSYAAVEFTGIDWSVDRRSLAFTAAGTDEAFTVTDVVDWAQALIVNCGLSTSSVHGNDEVGYTVRPGSSTTQVLARLRSGHSAPSGTDAEVAVLRNRKLRVEHQDSVAGGGTDFSGGGAAPQTVTVTVDAVPSTAEAAVEATADNDDAGTNYPSAQWLFRLASVSSVEFRRSRTVGGGDWALQVADFSGVDGSIVFDKAVTVAATAAPSSSGAFKSGSVAVRVTRVVAEAAFKPGRPKVSPIALPAVEPPFFAKNWASSCVLSSAWATDVALSSDLAEDRRALSDRPRRTMRARMTGLSRGEVLRLLMAGQRSLDQRRSVPLYCDHSRVTQASSGTVLWCVTAHRRFHVGGRVAVHGWDSANRPTGLQYATVKSVRDDRLVLESALSGTVEAGSRAYPTMDAEVSLDWAAQPLSDSVFDVQSTFVEVIGPSTLPASVQGLPPGAQYRLGRPIFDPAPDWSASLEVRLRRAGRAYEQGRGRVVAVEGPRPQATHVLTVTSMSRAQAWDLLQHFDGVKGRLTPFWLVSPASTFTPTAIATTHVDVEPEGNFVDLDQYLDHVAVVERGGTVHVRSIASTADNGSSWRITFDETIPSLVLSDVRKVTAAYLVRMSSDALEQRWTTDEHSQSTVEMVELLDETDGAVAGVEDDPSEAGPSTVPDLNLWVDACRNTWRDRSFTGTPDSRDVPGEPEPSPHATVHFWDDARLDEPPAVGPHLRANSSGHRLVAFANADISRGRRGIEHVHTGTQYWEAVRQEQAPWSNADGFTLFFCARTPPDTTSGGNFAIVLREGDSAEMFAWAYDGAGVNEVRTHIEAGDSDASMRISGLPSLADGRVRIGTFAWKPGQYSRVYYDGVLQGSAQTPAGSFPVDDVGSERHLDVNGTAAVLVDAGVGVQNKFYDHAVLTFARALTTAELNLVGQHLAKLYGAGWSDIT